MTQTAPSRLDDILDRLVLDHATPSQEALSEYLAQYPEYRDVFRRGKRALTQSRCSPA
jgi:hypothetical protein